MYWTVIYADAALKVMAFISSLLTAHLSGNTQTCIKKKKLQLGGRALLRAGLPQFYQTNPAGQAGSSHSWVGLEF